MPPGAFRTLVAHRISAIAIPSGGGLADGVKFLLDKDRMMQAHKDAIEWVNAAIDAVIAAPDNPYGTDRDRIAREMVRRLEERKGRPGGKS